MSHDLVKDIDHTVIPGVPGSAAYSYNTWVLHEQWFPVTPGAGTTGLPPGHYTQQIIGGVIYPIGGSGVSVFATAAKLEELVRRTVDVPAVPAIPPTVLVEYNEGWDAGARSVGTFAANGKAWGTQQAGNVGAAIGLGHFTLGLSRASLSGFDFGIVGFSGGVYTMLYGTTLFHAATYTPSTKFELRRRGDQVSYYLGGTLLRTVTDPFPWAPLFIQAALYYGGDTITNPFIGLYEGADVSLLGLRVAARGGASYATASVSLLPMTVSSVYGSRADVSMLPVRAHGSDHSEGQGDVTMQPMTAFGYSLPPELVRANGAALTLPYLRVIATGLTGGTGTAAVSMRRMRALGSDHPYGEVQVEFEPLLVDGEAQAGDSASFYSMTVVAAPLTGYHLVLVTMNSAGAITSAMTVQIVQDGIAQSAAVVASSYTMQQLLNAVMTSIVNVDGEVPLFSDGAETWVVNLDKELSYAYDSFAFNSFANIGGRYYGAKADGIYLLEGNTDAGAPIRASMALGKHNFKTNAKKRISSCYLGVSSDDTMYLKVIVDQGSPEEAEYIYAARGSATGMKTQRVDIGKGLRANYFSLEIFNKDGADFELDDVQFEIVDITRRI